MKLSHLTIIILLILTFSCSNNSDFDNNNLSILVISSDHSLGNNF